MPLILALLSFWSLGFILFWQRYKASGHDTIVLAGAEYGSGSSRDWAAKGPMLLVSASICYSMLFDFLCLYGFLNKSGFLTYLMSFFWQGVKAVISKSFERIHRSNLVGMGIIPLCFKSGEDADTLGLTGHERYTIDLPNKISEIKPGQDVTVTTDTGKSFTCTARFDTEVIEACYWLMCMCFADATYILIWSIIEISQDIAFIQHFEKLVSEIYIFPCARLLTCPYFQVELEYFNHGGILPYVIRNLIKKWSHCWLEILNAIATTCSPFKW